MRFISAAANRPGSERRKGTPHPHLGRYRYSPMKLLQPDPAQRLEPSASALLPQLNDDEEEFCRLVDSGDINRTVSFLEVYRDFNVNCQNHQGYTPLVVAIKNGDVDMVDFLLENDSIMLGDALHHSVLSGNIVLVEMILDKYNVNDHAYFPKGDSSNFPSDITPLVLAAQRDQYDIVKLLLDKGHTIEKPHPPTCFCDSKCGKKKLGETLGESRARYNIYQALSTPSYICQSSPDPILTAFELSNELSICSEVEREFKREYLTIAQQCSQFAVSLLDKCRSTEEVNMLLRHRDPGKEKYGRYPRLTLALKYDQRAFIAHPNCQQVLRAAWLEGWQDWRSLSFVTKVSRLIPRTVLLPVMALIYWIIPKSDFVKAWRSPLNKYFSFSASYIIFLVLLYAQNAMDNEKTRRGPPVTGLEWFIIIYVVGLAWMVIKHAWTQGKAEFFRQLWNLYTIVMLLLFVGAFICWAWASYRVAEDGKGFLPRKYWNQYDPTLISEAFYSVAVVLAFGRLLMLLEIGNQFGPLQISLSRMFRDIATFLVLFTVVMFSFAMGLNHLYWPYTGEVRHTKSGKVEQYKAFDTLVQATHTLYWSIYGYSPPYYADVILGETYVKKGEERVRHYNHHRLTEIVGHTLFSVFYVTGIIILVNMLIAMMSTSFSNVQSNADMEWKFARTRVWMTFFEDGNTLPPPFNLVPTPKFFLKMAKWISRVVCRGKNNAKCSLQKCCYYEKDEDSMYDNEFYPVLLSQLVQRYLTSQDRNKNHAQVTVEDLKTLKQDLKEVQYMTRLLAEKQLGINHTPGQESTA